MQNRPFSTRAAVAVAVMVVFDLVKIAMKGRRGLAARSTRTALAKPGMGPVSTVGSPPSVGVLFLATSRFAARSANVVSLAVVAAAVVPCGAWVSA
jgi:hypothetical protein